MYRATKLQIAAAATIACAAGDLSGSSDLEPITYKRPPAKKDGTGTVPACEGVPERGVCESRTATYCDLQREAINRVDCAAMDQACIEDLGSGAVCSDVDADEIDFDGVCEAGSAIWRDTETDKLLQWHCADDGLACQVDACAHGAYCCLGDSGEPAAEDCADLDFAGQCDGEVARWCADGVAEQRDCAAEGSRCVVDECADGAFCCDTPEPETDCDALGFDGECSRNVARWCEDGVLVENDCTAEFATCRLDACEQGAFCCPVADDDPCAEVNGALGVCSGNELQYCAEGEVTTVDCDASGTQCEVDTCFAGHAECC